jgi:ADP-heptose:LPS heptosyltransferase
MQGNNKLMDTTFIIDGGAGRLVTAIPALEKYAIANPNDDFRVLTAAWESLYWAHPLLQNKTFNINQKGTFDLHMKDRKVVHPEPYQMYQYYNKKQHIIQCFDKYINNTDYHDDLDKPNLYITNSENIAANNIIADAVKKTKKPKVIIFQPYGSGIKVQANRPVDESNRSLDVDFALKLTYNLSRDHTVIYFGEKEYYHPGDRYSVNMFDKGGDLRMYMSLIANCDYFIGVDSVGQHIARAFNKPGTIILGSTLEQNISYDKHFTIYRNRYMPTYVPIRMSQIDSDFANNLNGNTMLFDDNDIEGIINTIK